MTLLKRHSFTILELMVAIVIIAVIAGFAIPNYRNAIERNHRRDAEAQLTVLHGAANLFRAQNRTYWVAAGQGVVDINSNLNINLIENGMTFSYTGDATTFTATAVRQAPAPSFTITITQALISSTNPSCTAGACP